jgi:4'-phosphopantetheinyl transferase
MQIWHVDLRLDRGTFHRAWALMDPQERARCDRLANSTLRHRYAAAHAGLRRVLAHRLRCSPAQILLAREPGGKPRLRPGPGRPLHFSLSHAGDHGLVAMSAAHPVGIDVELLPPPPGLAADLASQLSPDESQALASLPPSARGLAALRCWVRKEALLKASGHGLARAPAALSVSWDETPRLLGSALAQYEPGRWQLAALEQRGAWTAAAAWAGAPETVRWLRWPQDAALEDAGRHA